MFKLIFSVAAVTALAQLLQLISQPLLTHLYTKESFGYFSIAVSVVTFSALLCNFQFNNLILVSKENTNKLFTSGFYFSIFMEIIVFTGLFVLFYFFFQGYRKILLFLIIFYLFFYCFNILFRAVMLKEGKNSLYSFGILLRSLVVVLFQVLFSFSYEKFGLILGVVVGEFILTIFGLFYGKELIRFSALKLKDILMSIYIEREFLLIGTIQEITSTAMFLAPLVLIVYKYSYAVGGEFSLVHKLAWGPAFLLAQVVSPILLQYVVKDGFKEKFLFNQYYSVAFFCITAIIAYYGCEVVFKLFIDNNWYNSIWMSKYIVIWVLSFIMALPYRILIRSERKQIIQFFIDLCILLFFMSILIVEYSFQQYILLLTILGVLGNFIIMFFGSSLAKERGWM